MRGLKNKIWKFRFLFLISLNKPFKTIDHENKIFHPEGGAFTAITLALSLCVHGCITDENPQPDVSKPFMHMDIPEDHLFSEAQLERLAAAFERVDEFVRIENDRASVDATANDVDMSEELFAFVTDRIEATNRQREIEKNVGHTGYRDAAQAQTNSHDPPA